jgi:hypothetical protein
MIGYLPYGKAGAVVEGKAEISRKPSIFGEKWQSRRVIRELSRRLIGCSDLEQFLPNCSGMYGFY